MVSNIFYFHPYLGKIPILTNIFQMGGGINHQLDDVDDDDMGCPSLKNETAEIGYSLLAVSPERHREFLLGLTSAGPFENGALYTGGKGWTLAIDILKQG